MADVTDPDLIWIRDVRDDLEFRGPSGHGPSAEWLYNHVEPSGPLTKVQFPGDRRTYLRRSQLRLLLRASDVTQQQQTAQQ